VMSEF